MLSFQLRAKKLKRRHEIKCNASFQIYISLFDKCLTLCVLGYGEGGCKLWAQKWRDIARNSWNVIYKSDKLYTWALVYKINNINFGYFILRIICNLRTSEPSDRWTFGQMKLRTDEPSDRWTFGQINLRTDQPSNKWHGTERESAILGHKRLHLDFGSKAQPPPSFICLWNDKQIHWGHVPQIKTPKRRRRRHEIGITIWANKKKQVEPDTGAWTGRSLEKFETLHGGV